MENKFIDGLFFNKPHENAPNFVKGNIKIQADRFIEYVKNNADAKGYVTIDLLESKEGKYYAKKNDWKPEQQNNTPNINEPKPEPVDTSDIDTDRIPF